MADEVKIPISLPGAAQASADAGKVAAGLKGVGDAAKQAGKDAEAQGKAAKQSGVSLEELGRKGSDAKDIFEGLSAVGRGQEGILFNLAKAWRGLTAAMATNPFLAIVGVVAGVISILAQLAEKIADSSAAFAGMGKVTNDVESKIKTLEAASKTATEAMKEGARGAAEEWQAVIKAIDAAQRRADALRGAELAETIAKIDEEEAAALLNTPVDARDSVKAKFERRRVTARATAERASLETSDLRAELERKSASEQMRRSRDRVMPFQEDFATARAAFEEAQQRGGQMAAARRENPALITPEALARAVAEVQVARRQFELAQERLRAAEQAEAPTRGSAQERLDRARDTLELNRIRRRTFTASENARQSNFAIEDQGALRREAQKSRLGYASDLGLRAVQGSEELLRRPGVAADAERSKLVEAVRAAGAKLVDDPTAAELKQLQDALLPLLRDMVTVRSKVAFDVAKLRHEVETLSAQIKNGPRN